MNQRRLLVLALGAGLSGHAELPRAQTPATGLRRVGVLAPSTRAKEEVTLKPFFDQMRELRWIEGQTIAYAGPMPTISSGTCPGLRPSWWRAGRSCSMRRPPRRPWPRSRLRARSRLCLAPWAIPWARAWLPVSLVRVAM